MPDFTGRKVVFISDVHMGAGKKPKAGKHSYDWLSKKEADSLAKLVLLLKDSGDVAEVVLLGDMIDDWVCPVDEKPPSYGEILSAEVNTLLVKRLRELSDSKKVIYMPGNHDMGVKANTIKEAFPNMKYGGSAQHCSRYINGRVHAEHGCAYTMFNAPDPLNDPRQQLPLGYFISRMVATMEANTGTGERHYWKYLDDFLESLGPQRLAASVFEAVQEDAGLPDDFHFQMNNRKLDAQSVKSRYSGLYDQWVELHGPGRAMNAVIGEFYLGRIADRIAKKGNAKIIVLGHSHNSTVDKDSLFVEDRIYANCGTWCDSNKPSTYVEVEKTAKQYLVRTMKWDGKSASTDKECHLHR